MTMELPIDTTITSGNLYLRIDEQDKVLEALRAVRVEAQLSEKFFLDGGEYIGCGLLTMQAWFYWRGAFRGFNLYKYAKHRLSTLMLCGASAVYAALVHRMLATDKLFSHFRRENPLYYGLGSLKGHAIGSASTFIVSTGVCFCVAQRAGIIPIPDNFVTKEACIAAIKYMGTKLKPYARSSLIATLAGCTIMSAVGAAEYIDSQNLLAKINRKTTSLRER